MSSSLRFMKLSNLSINSTNHKELAVEVTWLTNRRLVFSHSPKNVVLRSINKSFMVRCMGKNPPSDTVETGLEVVKGTTLGYDSTRSAAESGVTPDTDNVGGGGEDSDSGGGNGKVPPGGGGGGGGDGDSDSEEKRKKEKEYGTLLNFEEVIKRAKARGATIPSDILEAANDKGVHELFLSRYLDLQGSVWPLGFAMKNFPMFRDRMLTEPAFLFKIGVEIVIDCGCATFAEVKKRGKDFWAEFELYAADLLVGLVVNVAIVSIIAPCEQIGKTSLSEGFLGSMQRIKGKMPSSVFEAARPGSSFSVQQRVAAYFYAGILNALIGFGCGLIGQGIANSIMTAKRSKKKSKEDIPVPPLVKSAALWGVFLAVSSNTRYQVVNGLEGLVETSALANKAPPIARVFTLGVRFANNVYGGMQFVDWARLSGCQ